MASTFNPQILVEKLAKLNMSQQSIETLSHWCIFHMNKAKLVVETWDRQFHSSQREQKLAFLYLANDILQNSRRKGAEFVAEFWRVLPEALRDVLRNGDEPSKNAARRLINIWDERKVFGSQGHILKEEFMGRQTENNNKSGTQLSLKFRQSVGNSLDKIVSDYEMLYGGQSDEDALLSRCTNIISSLDKVVTNIGSEANSGKPNGSAFTEELQGQHASLRECIEQMTTFESSRASLVQHLREALQEQESKLDQVQSQLRAAQLQSDRVTSVCLQLIPSDNMLLDAQGSSMPPGFPPEGRQPSSIVYNRQGAVSNNKAEDDSRKSAAAAVAAKLTASTSSVEMLSHVLTSLVSGVAFNSNASNAAEESPGDHHHIEKKPKLENNSPPYASSPPPPPPPPTEQPPPPPTEQPPPPPFPHPDSIQDDYNTPTSQQLTSVAQPPPPCSSPPPLPPLPAMPVMPPYPMTPQFIQTAGSMSNVSYSFGATPQPPPIIPGYPSVGPPMSSVSPYGPPVFPYQNFQSSDGGFYSPPSSVPMAPMPHQQSL